MGDAEIAEDDVDVGSARSVVAVVVKPELPVPDPERRGHPNVRTCSEDESCTDEYQGRARHRAPGEEPRTRVKEGERRKPQQRITICETGTGLQPHIEPARWP